MSWLTPQRRFLASQAGMPRQQGACPLLTFVVSRLVATVAASLAFRFSAVTCEVSGDTAVLTFRTLTFSDVAAMLSILHGVDLWLSATSAVAEVGTTSHRKFQRIQPLSCFHHPRKLVIEPHLRDLQFDVWFETVEETRRHFRIRKVVDIAADG